MSGIKRFTQFDRDTGEVIGDFVAVVRPKSKSSFERHFTMNQAILIDIAIDLNHEQLKVLLGLFAVLDYENYICISQVELGKKLKMFKQNVSKALKGLTEKQIILEGPIVGRSKSYRLNPSYGWKGSATNHKKALKNGMTVIDGGKF